MFEVENVPHCLLHPVSHRLNLNHFTEVLLHLYFMQTKVVLRARFCSLQQHTWSGALCNIWEHTCYKSAHCVCKSILRQSRPARLVGQAAHGLQRQVDLGTSAALSSSFLQEWSHRPHRHVQNTQSYFRTESFKGNQRLDPLCQSQKLKNSTTKSGKTKTNLPHKTTAVSPSSLL